ncbi:hypothetical protein [Ephemeroptericola cinctiostellae]|nr:hypothetical protein [Ephemeroptericola cinctiostellae]
MRTSSFVLSVLLHLCLLTGLLLNAPTPEPLLHTNTLSETQTTLLTEVALTKKPNTSTASPVSTTETATQAIANMAENNPQTASSQISPAPEHPAHDVVRTNAKASNTPSDGAPSNAHSSKSPSAALAPSTSVTPTTAMQGEHASISTSAAAARDANDDTSPVRNRPQTKQMTCTASAKRQGLIGQVMAHVQIASSGIVQAAHIDGNSQDATMNQLAHEQAMRLKFPTVRNAAGTVVASYADVKLIFDCGSD